MRSGMGGRGCPYGGDHPLIIDALVIPDAMYQKGMAWAVWPDHYQTPSSGPVEHIPRVLYAYMLSLLADRLQKTQMIWLFLRL